MKEATYSPDKVRHEKECVREHRLNDLEDVIFENYKVHQIVRKSKGYSLESTKRPVIDEISLKIYIDNEEVASLLCLNQQQEELALGFLFSEGIINSQNDIASISYSSAQMSVLIDLSNGKSVKRQTSLRSITAGCGKCFTYINPQKKNEFKPIQSTKHFSLDEIVLQMQLFTGFSEVYRSMGGVHSLLLRVGSSEFFSEDIGRHNCFDKVIGTLLSQRKLELAKEGIVYISGRVTSEIMTKAIKLGVPVVVSKSTPSVAAIKLANEYNITLLGYVVKDQGFVYSYADRLIV